MLSKGAVLSPLQPSRYRVSDHASLCPDPSNVHLEKPSETSQRLKKLIFALKECSSSKDLQRGKNIHEAAVRFREESNLYFASSLIHMYAKCLSLEDARRVFDKLKSPDVVCWNVIILGYADSGQGQVALNLLWQMRRRGCTPDERTIVASLMACIDLASKDDNPVKVASMQKGKALHMLACSAFILHSYVQNTLIDMYAKCGSMDDARRVFITMKHPDVVCWNAFIFGYANNGESDVALYYFSQMKREGCEPNARTFTAALKACAELASSNEQVEKAVDRRRGMELHMLASRNGCDTNIYVQSTLIDMYAKCNVIRQARKVFDKIDVPDLVCWNALMMGYADNRESETALGLLSKMGCEGYTPSSQSFVAVLKVCSDLAAKEVGKEGNGKIIKVVSREMGMKVHLLALMNGCDSDPFVQVTLIDAYGKCGSMKDAAEVFERAKKRNVVCWNALILGYADNGEGGKALDVFERMGREGCVPDSRTFNATLQACGSIGALATGKKIHAEIRKYGLEYNGVLANALLDYYVKCGSLSEAEEVFESHPCRSLITWTTLMGGYSCHGEAKAVLGLFDRMRESGITPDGVTFKCIFTACNHAGLADVGRCHFNSMDETFGIKPEIEHYNSMVDIHGRANQLEAAMALVNTMPFTPNAVTWTTVLGACRKWKNVHLGRLSFEALINLEEWNSGAYILMGNIYGSKGMWEDQARLQALMADVRVSKNQPGRSWWTNEGGVVHAFLAGDKNHPQIREIQEKLEDLFSRLRKEGYVADLSSVTRNISDVEKEDALCGHSEKLAIGCALINTKPGETIRIVKNLRVCDDCHTASALISKLEKRRIICRDVNRFHVFEEGKCSCGGFW